MTETITTITNFDERFSMVFPEFLVLLHFSMEFFISLRFSMGLAASLFPTLQHGVGGAFSRVSFSLYIKSIGRLVVVS